MIKRIGKLLGFFAILMLFLSFHLESAEAAAIELDANIDSYQRITQTKRNIEYKIVVSESGYQNYSVSYLENPVNKIGDGYHIVVRNKERKILSEQRGLNTGYDSPRFGLKKGDEVFVSITEDFEEIDPVNGIDIKFIFREFADKYYEVEENDSFENANTLVNGRSIKGNFHVAADEDFFRYKALETGKPKVKLNTEKNHPELFDGFKLEIYDSSKNLISTNNYLREAFTLPLKNIQKGDELFLKVLSANQAEAPIVGYSLTISTKKKSLEEKEENDSIKKANKIKTRIAGMLSGEHDKDIFVFTPKKTKKYKISLDTEFLNGNKYAVGIITKKKGKVSLKKIFDKSGSFTIKGKKGKKFWISITGVKTNVPVAKEYTLEIK